MCLLDYNKEMKKYKHLTKAERNMIQRWINKDNKITIEETQKLREVLEIIRNRICESQEKFKKEENTIIGFKEGQRGTQFTRQAMM